MSHSVDHGFHFNPVLAVVLNAGAILFAMIEGKDIVMVLQAVSLIVAIVVGLVTLYEKLIKNKAK